MHGRSVVGLLICLGVCLPSLAQTNLKVQETFLTELRPGGDWKSITISPDRSRIAYIVVRGKEKRVVVDDVEGAPYADIEQITFSPDSRRLAYLASHRGEFVKSVNAALATARFHEMVADQEGAFAVVDGREQKTYSAIEPRSLVFSPDSKHLAYAVSGWRVVQDEVEGEQYDDISPFSLEGRSLLFESAYSSPREKPTLAFGPGDSLVSHVVLRREMDSSPLGYRFRWALVRDGKKGKEYERLLDCPVFSQDGTRVAYVVAEGNRFRVVVDKEEGKLYDDMLPRTLCFSPDGKRVGYIAGTGTGASKRWLAVVDGVEGDGYAGADALRFSPDSRRVAYYAWTRLSAKQPPSQRSDRIVLVVDGVASREYEGSVGNPVFSQDSRQVAGIVYTRLGDSAGTGSELVVLLDGKPGPVIGAIYSPVVFSPDGHHVAYRARLPKTRWALFVDGKRSAAYDGFPQRGSGGIAFDAAGNLTTIARQGTRLFQLRVDAADL